MADHRVALCILTLPLFNRARDIGTAALTGQGLWHFNITPFNVADGALSTLHAYASMVPAGFSDGYTPHWKEATRHDRPSHK